jgi:GT2 family glycosyltransferase/glycosyltransferase involved in cell wall biosynthesis
MRPLNLPARRVLRLPGPAWITWAVFDPDWYRMAHPAETAQLAGAPPEEVLRFYLDHGQRLGHSPNLFFDETWHRAVYPAIAALVREGRFESAFDSYCRGGALDRSPHWLFDEQYYHGRNPDLTDATLTERGLVNGYDHFLWRGSAEGRSGHPFFDPVVYGGGQDADESPFVRLLRDVTSGAAERLVSCHLDPDWYRARYPEVAASIAQGTWRSALEHYLRNDTPVRFDPNPGFSEADYLAEYADVAGAVRSRGMRNGYVHFVRLGIGEKRKPRAGFDLAWYANQPVVQDDIAHGLATDAFAHWLLIGKDKGLPVEPPAEAEPAGPSADTLFLDRARARALAVRVGRHRLNFRVTGTPDLSVIMVVHDQFTPTLATLASLRGNHAGQVEVILVDAGSADATRAIEPLIPGARVLRFASNIGSLTGCNAALPFTTSETVLYLSPAVELAPGAIAAGLRRLESDPQIALVGGMVLRPDGLVWEAGGIVWRDGTTEGYGRGTSPLAPEVNFVRDVDFCAPVFLMGRRGVLTGLGGYDTAYPAASCESADLCLRAAAAGHRVVYDPAIAVHHRSGDPGDVSRAERGRQVLQERQAVALARRAERSADAVVFARAGQPMGKRILFIEDTVPLRAIGSGFVRSNDALAAMAALGHAVTVFPITGCTFDLAQVYADMPDTVEVMHDQTRAGFDAFLAARVHYYDVIWVARTHNLNSVHPALHRLYGEDGPRPRLILDTEAITAVREAEQAALEGRAFDLDAATQRELRFAGFCDGIVAVTDNEAQVLRGMGLSNVTVLGHRRSLHPTPRPFAQRAGMLFLGAIHRMDSPNYDSLCWFVDHVLPIVEDVLGWQTRLTVAGYIGADVNLNRFEDHPRVTLRGEVANLEALYDAHRLLIAPTRFAAGVPYKVHEAASFGLPVVATELLRRQLDWRNGLELLSAEVGDAETFARHVISLQQDETLWLALRDAALRRLRAENDSEGFSARIFTLLS